MKGQDTVDLRDLRPGLFPTATYSGTSSGGTLTVADGADAAHIALSGDYLGARFIASSDGHGGTSVIESLMGAHHNAI